MRRQQPGTERVDVSPDHPEHGGGAGDPGPWGAGMGEAMTARGHLAALEEGGARSGGWGGGGQDSARQQLGLEPGPEGWVPHQETPLHGTVRLAQGGGREAGSRASLTPQLPSPGADSEVKEEVQRLQSRVDMLEQVRPRLESPRSGGLSLGGALWGCPGEAASRVPLVWAPCPADDVWDPRKWGRGPHQEPEPRSSPCLAFVPTGTVP